MVLKEKNLPANSGDVRDVGSIPGSRRCPGVENGNPLQFSCLENPMDKGAWWATVPGVTKVRYNLAIKPSTIKGIKDHRNKRLQKEN